MNLPIHPFPARMAPELALEALQKSNKSMRLLDPMSGSGTTLRHASLLGHEAHGRDLDPLAVLMAGVWTTPVCPTELERYYQDVLKVSLALDPEQVTLTWIDDDPETSAFIKFWFGQKQRSALRCIFSVLMNHSDYFDYEADERLADVLKVALSRIIITKEQRASLARDTSHSRPHKVAEESEYDVFQGFKTSVQQVMKRLLSSSLKSQVFVELGDARSLDFDDEYFDAILTSPPYLNAIDYMRGHKLALVWMGFRIGELRSIRSGSIGAEKAPEEGEEALGKMIKAFGDLSGLPRRHIRMIERYSVDLSTSLGEAARVLRKGGTATYVVGNSCLKGVFVQNSEAVAVAGEIAGMEVVRKFERELPQNRRYLPVNTDSPLQNRMRTETILEFKRP
ncbi:MAG: hypothetical protein AAF718_04640 [Pseudomonadota bacterium]